MVPFARALRFLNRHGQYGSIGVEVSIHELHMVQLHRVGERLEVAAYVSMPHGAAMTDLLTNPNVLGDLIKQGLRREKFVGRSTIAAMPAFYTQIMPVSYQSSTGQGEGAAIGKLMQERIGDISEFVIDYMPVQTLYEGKEKLALVAISREETVVNFLEMLRKAGLRVEALEVGPIAIRRLIVALQPPGRSRNTLVVNCGREKSYLTLLSDDRLLADDEIDFGEETILDSVCTALEMSRDMARGLLQEVNLDPNRPTLDTDKARNATVLTEIVKPQLTRLAQEIRRGLMFAQSESRGARQDQVYLLGSIARWPGTTELLASLTDSPVAPVPSPLDVFASKAPAGESRSAPELAVATGLALRGFMNDV